MASTDTSLKIRINKSDLSGESEEDPRSLKQDKLYETAKAQNCQRKTYNFRLHNYKRNFASESKPKRVAKKEISQTAQGLCDLICDLNKSDASAKTEEHAKNSETFWPQLLQGIKANFAKKAENSSLKRKKESKEMQSIPKKKLKSNNQPSCFIENKDFVKECSKNSSPMQLEDENTQPSTEGSNSSSNSPQAHVEQNKTSPPINMANVLYLQQQQSFNTPNCPMGVTFTPQSPNTYQTQNHFQMANSYPFTLNTCMGLPNVNIVQVPQNFLNVGSLINGNIFMNNMNVIPNYISPVRNTNACIMNINSLPHLVISPFSTLPF